MSLKLYIRTDPNSVPFLDIAKYSPLLTDLMATTPTLTDRISIRPGKKRREQECLLETYQSVPIKSHSLISDLDPNPNVFLWVETTHNNNKQN